MAASPDASIRNSDGVRTGIMTNENEIKANQHTQEQV